MSQKQFQPPLFVFEGLDLTIHETLESVETSLEGVDVQDGIYEIFDSAGRSVRLEATGVHRAAIFEEIGESHVNSVEAIPTGAKRLHELLRDHLRAIGQKPSEKASLADLVTESASIHKKPLRK